MYEYILRWQIGLSLENRKIHYTYGSKEALRKKAKALATISEKIIERFKNL